MTKKTRTLLFLAATFLFLVTAPSVVLYSQGYRIDIERKKITQTGGISLTAFPNSAQVYIDGKFKKNTGFLSGKAFIQNVLPGDHQVAVKKSGYIEWRKELKIRERLITEATNVILLPQDPAWNALSHGIKNYWSSPDGSLMLLKRGAANVIKLEFFDPIKNTYTELLFEGKDVLLMKGIVDVIWLTDKSEAILKSSAKEYPYLVANLDSGKVSRLNWPTPAIRIIPHPLDKNKFLILSPAPDITTDSTSNTIWSYDLVQKYSQPLLRNILDFAVVPEGIIWLSKDGRLYLSNFSGDILRELNTEPHPINPKARYQINALNPQKVLLIENSAAFILHPTTKLTTKIGDKIQKSAFSPDQRKAAFIGDHEVWILYFEPQSNQPAKQAGEYNLLTRFSEKIEDLAWMGSNYVIIKFSNKIKVVEIDDRDGINIDDIKMPENGAGQINGVFFGQATKQLYALLGEELFGSKKLLP